MTGSYGLRLAQGLSLAAHPLPMMGLLVLALAAPQLAAPQSGALLLLATLMVGAALAVFIHWQVHAGRGSTWTLRARRSVLPCSASRWGC